MLPAAILPNVKHVWWSNPKNTEIIYFIMNHFYLLGCIGDERRIARYHRTDLFFSKFTLFFWENFYRHFGVTRWCEFCKMLINFGYGLCGTLCVLAHQNKQCLETPSVMVSNLRMFVLYLSKLKCNWKVIGWNVDLFSVIRVEVFLVLEIIH